MEARVRDALGHHAEEARVVEEAFVRVRIRVRVRVGVRVRARVRIRVG